MEKYALYRELLNLPELEITDVVLSDHKIVIACWVKSDVTERTCPKCGKATSCVNQEHVREVRDLSICGREVWLEIRTRQFVCRPCNYKHQSR